jgi:hypothetical protein
MGDAIGIGDLVEALREPLRREELLDRDSPLLVVDLGHAEVDVAGAPGDIAALPVVVVGIGDGSVNSSLLDLVDVVVADADALSSVERGVRDNPIASTALGLLLRGSEGRSIDDGLVAESAVYSMLQAGPEFASWRSGRAARVISDGSSTVRMERVDDVFRISLDRPARHNALNTRMRDELYEAFLVAAADPSLAVVLEGLGPSFCSGGDLDEFGSRVDPASAHVIRLRRSVGRLIASIAERVTATVHGACIGSGIELPAFAGRVVARHDARFALPEIALGLVPGAGGTVSLPRRIGRQRTAYLALTGSTIDAETALEWRLVDELRAD